MSEPTVYYICKFPSSYRNRTWFNEDEKDSAKRFVKRVKEDYGVRGVVKKVVEAK